VFPVKCGAWFGLEGQHEPKDAESNPDGAPLELYIGNMWWDDTSKRTIKSTMAEIKTLGINMIRLPVTPQTLEKNNEQGMTKVWDGNKKNPKGRLKNKSDAYPYANARAAMEGFIKEAKDAGLKVMPDIHSCSNFVGWRKDVLNANPPYVDATREGYEFTREEHSCGGETANDKPYNETKWLADLKDLATLAKTNDNIIAIDIFNEPWGYTWDEWATLAEKAYVAINSVNKDVLIFVEGIGSGLKDGTKVDHGDPLSNPNWGENIVGFKNRPLNIPKDRLVFSPHVYGPSVFVQKQFMTGDCAQLEGDEAGKAKCQIDIAANKNKLKGGWDEHFGYLRAENYAIVIGEYGGNMDWPQKGVSEANLELWGHVTNNPDEAWQKVLGDYMIEKKIEGCYWSINPESGDTGGIFTHKYDPISNDEAWSQWGPLDTKKTALLKKIWAQ
jgi:aryl-phospho-beta-D-glucosidase BglC (GH1 family)